MQAPTGPASKGGKKGGRKGKGRKGKAAVAAGSTEESEGVDMPQAATSTAAAEPLDVPGQPGKMVPAGLNSDAQNCTARSCSSALSSTSTRLTAKDQSCFSIIFSASPGKHKPML